MRKDSALQFTKYGNSSHPRVSAHYHTNKTISNSQTWNSPNNCKGGNIKVKIIKLHFVFAAQLAYSVILEISGWQGSLTQQPYELLWQLHRQ